MPSVPAHLPCGAAVLSRCVTGRMPQAFVNEKTISTFYELAQGFLSCFLPSSLCKGAKIRAIQSELMGAFLIGREGFRSQESHDPGLVAILQ